MAKAPAPLTPASDRGLAALLRPGAVAIVGASSDPGRIGGRPLKYFRQYGFQGQVYPINPNHREVQGFPAFARIAEAPGPIDLAVIALPAGQVLSSLREAAAKGAKAAIVFSAGFAEAGPEGIALQAELVRLAQELGVRLLGPNCLGLFDATTGHSPTFTSFIESIPPIQGRLAFITQSGAYGAHLLTLARQRGIGVKLWISTGNEADLGVAECLAYALEDPGVEAAILYAEAIKNGPLFLEVLARARALGKPVAIIKVGRSTIGAAAAASHTASLAGSDQVYEAVFRQFGVERAETTEQLLDFAYAADKGRLPKGNRLGILTVSGGAGVLMADAAETYGFELPPLPEPAQARLKALVPFGTAVNPVDVTAQALNEMDLVRIHLETMLEEGGYDLVACFVLSWPASPSAGPKLRAALIDVAHRYPDRVIAVCAAAPDPVIREFEAAGFLVFEDPARLIATMAAALRFGRRREQAARASTLKSPELSPHASAPMETAPHDADDELGAKRLLAAAGLKAPIEHLARSAAEAVAFAQGLKGPVALKIVSPDIAHKTEVGGVMLDLRSAEDVGAGFAAILARARKAKPDARIEGVLVSPMVTPVAEMILGLRMDPVFGPVIMVGFGGILTEVVRDTVLRIGPVSEDEALRMVRELKAFPLLAGARGRPKADLTALASAISRLSIQGKDWAGRFDSIEINPLAVLAEGSGVLMLDALVVPRAKGAP